MSDDNHTILLARVATLEAKVSDLASNITFLSEGARIASANIRTHDEILKDLVADMMAILDDLDDDKE